MSMLLHCGRQFPKGGRAAAFGPPVPPGQEGGTIGFTDVDALKGNAQSERSSHPFVALA